MRAQPERCIACGKADTVRETGIDRLVGFPWRCSCGAQWGKAVVLGPDPRDEGDAARATRELLGEVPLGRRPEALRKLQAVLRAHGVRFV